MSIRPKPEPGNRPFPAARPLQLPYGTACVAAWCAVRRSPRRRALVGAGCIYGCSVQLYASVVSVYIYIYIYTPMYIYIYIYTHIPIHIYIYIYEYIYIYTPLSLSIYIYIRICICIYIHIHIYIYIYLNELYNVRCCMSVYPRVGVTISEAVSARIVRDGHQRERALIQPAIFRSSMVTHVIFCLPFRTHSPGRVWHHVVWPSTKPHPEANNSQS